MLLVLGFVALLATHEPADAPQRPPIWKASRVQGSPEPPTHFVMTHAFPKLQRFVNPLELIAVPESNRLLVVEQSGKIFTFANDTAVAKADLMIDLAKDLKMMDLPKGANGFEFGYGIAFHPKFAENRFVYVCYTIKPKEGLNLADGSRVSRFTVPKGDVPKIDPASEKVIITFPQGGHNGGSLKFGHDGYLYISTGDAASPNPPDPFKTGQDCSDLLGSILRIDVDKEANGKAYTIPSDNPFVGVPNVKGEVWAFGFRNPWRMSFDRKTGELWVGDVGWELWEMVHRVTKGGNYGWSIVEGRQPINTSFKQGPSQIIPPLVELPHSIAASVTGGFVYRGKQFPELTGKYIFGDWETRRIWSVNHDGSQMTDLADPSVRIVAFGEDHAGELYTVDYDAGTIHGLIRNPAASTQNTMFPRKLSETGIFADVVKQQSNQGVLGFDISAQQWSDGAASKRWLGLTSDEPVLIYPNDVPIPGSMFSRRMEFPANAVLVRSISLPVVDGSTTKEKLIETQLLHFDGKNWAGYTYAWNDQQTDADLVPAAGMQKTLQVPDERVPGGKRTQHHIFHSRTQCIQCHNLWAQSSLAFNLVNLNREVSLNSPLLPFAQRSESGTAANQVAGGNGATGKGNANAGTPINQLKLLAELGVIKFVDPQKKPVDYFAKPASEPFLCDPFDASKSLDNRAKSYFQINCGHCHRFGGGGSVDLELHLHGAFGKLMGRSAQQGNFDLPNAKVISPGKPMESVLLFRMAKNGRGRMPHLGSEFVDEAGLQLIESWIAQLPPPADPNAKPNDTNAKAPAANQPVVNKSAESSATQQPTNTLADPATAYRLARSIGANKLPPTERDQILDQARQASNALIRDLFDGFQPEANRRKTLGNQVNAAEILRLTGDAERGRKFFWLNATVNCRSCHHIAGGSGSGQTGQGKPIDIGPELTNIGKQRTRAELLESLLDPSKKIDAAYQASTVMLNDGTTLVGIVKKVSDQVWLLRDSKGAETKLDPKTVSEISPCKQSIMPDGQYRDMTEQELVDLLDYLASLKG